MEQRILTQKCITEYIGKVAAEEGLPFKYVNDEFGTMLLYMGKGDLESDIMDLYDAVRLKNFNVAAQLPLLEDLCPQWAAYQGETDDYVSKLVSNGILDKEDRYTLTEKGFDLLESNVDVGAVAGVGFSMPVKMGKYLRSKFAELGISVKRPSKLKAFLAAAVIVAAGVGGAAISKNVHADSRGVEKDWYEKSLAVHPSPRQGAAMSNAHDDSKVILFGGSNGNNTNFLGDTWAYDDVSGIWEPKNPAQSPSVRTYSSMAGVYGSSKVVLFGGWAGADEKNDTWVYDLKTNTWTNMTPPQSPPARDSAAMASVYGDDKVVLFGGMYNGLYPYGLFGDTWVYDLSDNVWTKKPAGPSARFMPAMAGIYGSSKVLMFGGADSDNALGDTWIYDVSASQWSQKAPAQSPAARSGHAMAGIYGDDKVVLFGGRNKITETWIYDLSDGAWTQKPTTSYPGQRSYHSMSGFYSKDDIVLFGGVDSYGNAYGDTWIYGAQVAPPQNPNAVFVVAADTHIGATNANKSLEDFVTQVNSMNPKPACVFVAGDVSDYGSDGDAAHKGSSNLKLAKSILNRLDVPYYVVPGNHDARQWAAGFGSVPGAGDNFKDYKAIMPLPSNSDNYKVELNKLTVFCMNSGTDNLTSLIGDPLLPESTGLTSSQVSWLESALKSTPTENQRVLVMHNPITLDKDGSVTNNYAKLLQLCQQYKVTVISGHTHQLAEEKIGSMDSWQVPSLAYQKSFEIVSFSNNLPVFSHRVLQQSTGIESHSPVDVQIIGPGGKTSGISNGDLKQGLSGTTFIREDSAVTNSKDSVEYLSVDGMQKKFVVQGLGDGIYNVKIGINDDASKTIVVSGKTHQGQIDTFEVKDWSAVAKNKPDSVKVSRDVNGDGQPEKVFSSSKTITETDFDNAKPSQQPGKPASLQYVAGGAAGLAAAAGAGYVLLNRQKLKRKHSKK